MITAHGHSSLISPFRKEENAEERRKIYLEDEKGEISRDESYKASRQKENIKEKQRESIITKNKYRAKKEDRKGGLKGVL